LQMGEGRDREERGVRKVKRPETRHRSDVRREEGEEREIWAASRYTKDLGERDKGPNLLE